MDKAPRTVSLRLTISAAAVAAALSGGAAAAVPAIVGGNHDQLQDRELAHQVAELREERAANRIRFEEILRRLDSIEAAVKPRK